MGRLGVGISGSLSSRVSHLNRHTRSEHRLGLPACSGHQSPESNSPRALMAPLSALLDANLANSGLRIVVNTSFSDIEPARGSRLGYDVHCR
jgi:hypothetical protein